MLKHALSYAERGWSVFPVYEMQHGRCSCGKANCNSPGKHPRICKWQDKTTVDKVKIKSWWKKWPDANIGIVTGQPSGLVVLDIDTKTGGYSSLEQLQSQHTVLPDTLTQITGSGGKHYLFSYPDGVIIKNSASKLAPGLDIRAIGGYILAPPSNHQTGGSYAWESDYLRSTLAPVPEWIKDRLTQLSQPLPSIFSQGCILEGGRNNHLMSYGGKLRCQGMSKSQLAIKLAEENSIRCLPPDLSP